MVGTQGDPNANTATNGRIGYAVTAISGAPLADRVPHRLQSLAAAALLTSLGGDRASATSKSHSRAAVAAAMGNAASLKLGIDVEWMSPDRPFAAIMHAFAPSLTGPLDRDCFYRGWTFLEAYFKAFQELPNARAIAEIVTADAKPIPLQIGDGVWVRHDNVFEVFKLCLVWKSSELCAIEPLHRSAMIDTPDPQN